MSYTITDERKIGDKELLEYEFERDLEVRTYQRYTSLLSLTLLREEK